LEIQVESCTGLLPQDYALFPHMTVAENVGFGLLRRSRHEARQILKGSPLPWLVQLEPARMMLLKDE
jgi:iron(III) transport system ATP-binding protein